MARTILLLLLLALSNLLSATITTRDLLVHFDKDESVLTPAATDSLDAFLASLVINGDYAFTIHGHTDSDGSLEYNVALSQARAETVLRYLVEHGADPALITVERFGELDPLVPNQNAEGMAHNRRVHVAFTRHSYADTEELRQALMAGSVQHFTIDPTKDQVVCGTAGIQLQLEAGSLVDALGRPANGPVDLELTEALGLQAILAHRLSTRSGSRMLETGGMLKVQATDANGAELRLKASAPMQVALPATVQEKGMEVFLSDDGADWTTTGSPIATAIVTTWQEPRYPQPPTMAYRWPRYQEDQKGKPVKPVEPVLRRVPQAPRRESYSAAKPWWAFIFPARAAERANARYEQAMANYAEQMARFEKKRAAYGVECDNYPERLDRYWQRKAEWDALKQQEYDQWHTDTYLPAKQRYDALMAPKRARYDSLVANWKQVREASMQQYVLRSDSMNTADLGGLNAYVFTTSNLGWINCDRFRDVPEEMKYAVVVDGKKYADAQTYLVFTNMRSMMGMARNNNGEFVSPPVARSEPAMLFAYAVIDGRAHVCMQPVAPSAKPKLTFEPSSFAEIGELLKSLGQWPG
ncbi:MAG TPA: OmpA family protein [Flavobacteriales bacterium]|nr:OmpA family protein [Flavobacteriales bacterium]